MPCLLQVYLPEAYYAEESPVPVIYYLSGLTCTDENASQKSGIQRYADEHGIAVVFPDTSPRGHNVDGESDSWDFGVGAGETDRQTHTQRERERERVVLTLVCAGSEEGVGKARKLEWESFSERSTFADVALLPLLHTFSAIPSRGPTPPNSQKRETRQNRAQGSTSTPPSPSGSTGRCTTTSRRSSPST